MRPINLIVIHCSATLATMDVGAAEIRRWHRDRGFLDIGYHYVIRRNGETEPGRPLEKIGAHAEGFNANSIGVCLVGGANAKGRGENNFEQVQFKTLKSLVYQLKCQFPDARICGHRDLPKVAKDCPSFNVKEWLNAVGLASE